MLSAVWSQDLPVPTTSTSPIGQVKCSLLVNFFLFPCKSNLIEHLRQSFCLTFALLSNVDSIFSCLPGGTPPATALKSVFLLGLTGCIDQWQTPRVWNICLFTVDSSILRFYNYFAKKQKHNATDNER